MQAFRIPPQLKPVLALILVSVSESKQVIGKEMPISFSPEQIERNERLERKYEDWVRKGIIVPQKYEPTPTPEEFALKHKIGEF